MVFWLLFPVLLLCWQVVYATKSQADIAFNGIPSNAQEDTSGRLQKKIYTSVDGKKYIAVSCRKKDTDKFNITRLFYGKESFNTEGTPPEQPLRRCLQKCCHGLRGGWQGAVKAKIFV